MENPSITCISQCVDRNGKTAESSVARDTYRCYMTEKSFPNVKVYTVNKCMDIMCTCDNDNDPTNINCDVQTRHFHMTLKERKWSFNEVYVDIFRMQKLMWNITLE